MSEKRGYILNLKACDIFENANQYATYIFFFCELVRHSLCVFSVFN